MNSQRTALSMALAVALGVSLVAAPATALAAVKDGNYNLIIDNTPYTTKALFGSDGAWNSSFTFGCLPGTKGCGSQYMYDNGATSSGRGSGIAGDTYAGLTAARSQKGTAAGVINITVKNNGTTFGVNSFSVDTIAKTAGGAFAQYTDKSKTSGPDTVGVSGMSGAISGTTMTFDPTGRLGAVNTPTIVDAKWDIDDLSLSGTTAVSNGNTTAWQTFTTGTTTGPKGVITGTALHSLGDLNGDGVTDWGATLVSSGHVGSAWPGFFGATYYEAWNVTLLSSLTADPDASTTNAGTAVDIDVLANDTSPKKPITLTLPGTSTQGGTLSLVTVGSKEEVRYVPPSSFTGTDTFTYTDTDASGRTDTGKVTVTVNAVGTPVANNDTGTTKENQSVAIDVVANDGSTIDKSTVTITTPPTNGTVGVSLVGVVTYQPNPGFVGTDTFRYDAKDATGTATSNKATVTVTVNAAILSDTGTVQPGATAVSVGSSDGRLNSSQVPPDTKVAQACVGGCFDFKVTGLSAGAQAKVVLLPLSTPIPKGTVAYRKYKGTSWVNFDSSTGDSIASAPGSSSSCPAASSSQYVNGLQAGDSCVRLTITDGGPNDADGSANGTIADPGGVALVSSTSSTSTSSSSSGAGLLSTFQDAGGCTIASTRVDPRSGADWWLIGGVLATLGLRRRLRRRRRG